MDLTAGGEHTVPRGGGDYKITKITIPRITQYSGVFGRFTEFFRNAVKKQKKFMQIY